MALNLQARAARGDAEARFRLGYRCAFHRDPKRRDWPAAVRYCSILRWNMLRLRPRVSHRKARGWYRLAAEGDHEVAAYNLAIGLRDGVGVRRDSKGAARWFGRAAASGDPEAQADFAVCLHEGRGVRRDRAEAVQLYRRAARAGVLQGLRHEGILRSCSILYFRCVCMAFDKYAPTSWSWG